MITLGTLELWDFFAVESRSVEGRYLILADYAEFSPSGRLNLIGGDLERFSFEKLPSSTPPFRIVGKIHLNLEEKDKDHPYQLFIKDPDGIIVSDTFKGMIVAMSQQFKPDSAFAGIAILFTHAPIQINKKGCYSIELLVENEIVLKTSFYVFVMHDK